MGNAATLDGAISSLREAYTAFNRSDIELP
jgi:hypothetical protein